MAVDASTPVPDELDARVEQMLAHMDRVHAEVVNRLDGPTDESGSMPTLSSPAPSGLEAEVEKALSKAAEAAKATSSNGADVPTATIKELDERLASAVSVDQDDDDFADGSSMVEGLSLDVPLPESSPLGELPAVNPPEQAVAAAVVVEPPPPKAAPVEPAPVAAPVVKPAPAPVPAPAAKPAAAPSKPVTPAVIPAPVKPAGPTFADRFWRFATPVMEPIAVRLGKLPVGFQHTVGWIGIVTLFMAGATWTYVFCFQETRVASHIPGDENGAAVEPEAKPDAHGEVEAKKAVAPAPSADTAEKKPSAPQGHGAATPKPSGH